MVDAVLGGEGLGRVAQLAAEALDAPVAIVVPRLGVACVAPAAEDPEELERWVADRVADRETERPRSVLLDAPIAAGEELVGIVAVLASDAGVPAEGAAYLHLAAVASLTEVAVAEAKEEVVQNLHGSFIEELRTRQDVDAAEIVRRASRLGCELVRGLVVLCAELSSERPAHAVATIRGEWPGALAQLDNAAGGPRVYALLPATGADGAPEETLAAARRLANRLQRLGTVGLSSFYADPAALPRAIQEAELVLDVVSSSGVPLAHDIGSGAYRLLFRVLASHPEEVRAFYEDTVAPLVRYDEQYRTDLLQTLESYLANNCNMNATAAAIYAHRHTVAYRLERVKELTGLDPLLSEDRERLGLGLKAYRVILPRLPR
jgi:sugar diacid utilization regulator